MESDEGAVRRAEQLQIVSFAQGRGEHLDPEVSLRLTLCPEGDSVIYRGRPIRVSTIVIGLDGEEGGVFAGYSQWEPGETSKLQSRRR